MYVAHNNKLFYYYYYYIEGRFSLIPLEEISPLVYFAADNGNDL